MRPSIPREDRIVMTKAVKALTPDNHVAHFEIRVELPGQDLRWHLWTTRAIYDEVGRLVEHQAVGRDVTERVRSQQQIRESRNMLRSVFDGISDPLIMVRDDMTLIMLNRAALRFFGALLYRDLIGTPCLEFFQGRYGEEATHLVQAVIAEQEPARHELATKGDSARYEEVFVYPVHAGGGNRSRFSQKAGAVPRIETDPPDGDVVINGDAATTNSRQVTLTLSSSPDTVKMKISNHPAMANTTWQPFVPTLTWQLPATPGDVMVYVLFQDAAGNVSEEPASDTITLNLARLYLPLIRR